MVVEVDRKHPAVLDKVFNREADTPGAAHEHRARHPAPDSGFAGDADRRFFPRLIRFWIGKEEFCVKAAVREIDPELGPNRAFRVPAPGTHEGKRIFLF